MNLNKIENKYSEEKLSSILKISFIHKLPNGKYKVLSEKGKNLGVFDSKKQALQRLKQIEFFKHKKAAKKEIDLKKIDEFRYSNIIRKINKDKELALKFRNIFKSNFDKNICNDINLDKIEKLSLIQTLKELSKEYVIKIDSKLIKIAEIQENYKLVGKYISNIIKFLLTRISVENRYNSSQKVKNKIKSLDINMLANKKLPASASIGQSITFVKNILMNRNPTYIKQVIDEVMNNL